QYLLDNGFRGYEAVTATIHTFAKDPEFVLERIRDGTFDPEDLAARTETARPDVPGPVDADDADDDAADDDGTESTSDETCPDDDEDGPDDPTQPGDETTAGGDRPTGDDGAER
ncbi:MAG: hypothetical protein ACOCSF_06930, partial [Halanaeroarchaeum sp.]